MKKLWWIGGLAKTVKTGTEEIDSEIDRKIELKTVKKSALKTMKTGTEEIDSEDRHWIGGLAATTGVGLRRIDRKIESEVN